MFAIVLGAQGRLLLQEQGMPRSPHQPLMSPGGMTPSLPHRSSPVGQVRPPQVSQTCEKEHMD